MLFPQNRGQISPYIRKRARYQVDTLVAAMIGSTRIPMSRSRSLTIKWTQLDALCTPEPETRIIYFRGPYQGREVRPGKEKGQVPTGYI